MKKMVYGSWLFLVLLVVLSLLLAGCKPSVTGRLAGDVPPLRYQQLLACEQGGRSMTECRGASAITVEQYQALVAQAGGAPPELQTHTVDIQNSAFPALTINVGDTVIWTNRDQDQHTVTQGVNRDPMGGFNSGDLATDASFSHTFNEAGNFDYFCRYHNNMNARVVVNAVWQAGGDQGDGEDRRVLGPGQACANNDECAAGLKCMYQVCQTQSCTETDAENLPLVAGVVTLDNSVTEDVLKKDECVNANQIREWFCPLDGGANARAVACPPGTTCQLNAEGVALCQAGAPPGGAGKPAGEACANNDECAAGLRCLSQICQTQTCADTEGDVGVKDVTIPGTVTVHRSISPDDLIHKDECLPNTPTQITEYFCEDATSTGMEILPCPEGTTCQLVDDVAVCQAGAPPAGAYGALCHADADCQFGCIIPEQVCNKQNPVAGTFGGACVNGGCTNPAQDSCYQNVCITKANADRLNALPGGNLVRVDRWRSLLSERPVPTNFPHQDTVVRMDFIPMDNLCEDINNLIPVTRRDANYCSFNVNQDNYVRADGGDVKTLNNYIFFYVPNDQAVSNVRTIEIDAGKDPAEAKKTGFHILTNSLLVPPGQNGWQWRKYCEFTENQNEMTCTATINQNVNLIMLARARWGATSPSAYIKDIRLNK